MATRRGRRFSPTARRKMIWARNGDTELEPPATGTAIDLLADFRTDGGSSLGATVTRTHLVLNVLWKAVVPELSQNTLFVGLIVDQLNQPTSEVPRPAVELHADWMHWRSYPPVPTESAVGGGDLATPAALWTTHVIDVKAQRRMEELGETLWLVLDPTFGAGTTVQIAYSSSVLLKLP